MSVTCQGRSAEDACASNQHKLLIVDAHVHFHACFSIDDFLSHAAQNVSAIAAQIGVPESDQVCGVLMMTESAGADWFSRFQAQVALGSSASSCSGAWRFSKTSEPQSLVVSGPNGEELIIIGGRQVVTAERLEVLWLGTTEEPADGQPVTDVINAALAVGAVPVLPWGFGKWLGRRSRIMASLLADKTLTGPFHLGDNSGRPAFFPAPRFFKQAQQQGLRILPGSDPLPFGQEVARPGSFGFYAYADLGTQTPFRNLKVCIDDPAYVCRTFGQLESPVRFVRNQLAMQLRQVWRT